VNILEDDFVDRERVDAEPPLMDYGMMPPMGGGFMPPRDNISNNIYRMTQVDEEIHRLKLTFENKVEDSQGNVRSLGEPLMNDLGINEVLGILGIIMNRNTVMSNLETWEIQSLMEYLSDNLARNLMMNRVRYEIKTPTARDTIYFSSLMGAFVVFKRGFEEGDKRFWKGTQQDITMRNEGGSQKKGMLSRFMSLVK
jgi:hypothetical protein